MAELTRDTLIDASPQTIWPFLVDPTRHVEWLGTIADIDPRPGGHYRVLVRGQHPSVGEYVEVVPFERVVFTFGWDQPGNPITPGSSRVEISLHPEGDMTRVRLTHSGIPAEAVGDHTGGWDHYLDRLSIRASGGDPGPDMAAAS